MKEPSLKVIGVYRPVISPETRRERKQRYPYATQRTQYDISNYGPELKSPCLFLRKSTGQRLLDLGTYFFGRDSGGTNPDRR